MSDMNGDDPMNRQLERQFKDDFIRLGEAPDVFIQLTATAAWCLLGQLQLACRHPRNNGASRQVAEDVAHEIQDRLATTPALRRVAEMGWDPQYDVEVEG